MNMIPVISTNLAAVGYDEGRKELYIQFHGGGTYVYSGVPVSVYKALMSASSHGEYHAAHIKNVYPYRRIG